MAEKLAPNTGFNHNLAAFIYPLENHTIGFNWDQVNSVMVKESLIMHFLIFHISIHGLKRKIDFELKWMNIANRRVFETYDILAAQNAVRYTRIQPDQAR
ncbi:hypothetical protein [Chryseobacterium indoltheticum]|uniref:hypothetical protein n=1 Tax=Chryseobacterium indoltheticum TaxID=254 RepID=UPI003F496165